MRSWRAISVGLVGCLAGGCAGDGPDTGLRVTEVHSSLVVDRYRVEASLDIQLTDAVLEALHNGVPITLSVDTRLRQPRRWLWPRTIASESRSYVLSYQSLSAQYVVRWPGDTGYRAYPSRHVAFSALESPEPWYLDAPDGADADTTHFIETRVQLDLQALPTPLSLMAFFSPDWRIGSGWHREKLAP